MTDACGRQIEKFNMNSDVSVFFYYLYISIYSRKYYFSTSKMRIFMPLVSLLFGGNSVP